MTERNFVEFLPIHLRQVVLSAARTMRAQRGRTLVSAGARSTDVFLVMEGEIQILLYSSSGREVSVRGLRPGDVFGELAALDGRSRSASAIATTDVRVQVLKADEFLACIGSSPEAGQWLCRRLGTEVRRLTERVFELSALNVRARLHCELLRLAHAGGQKGRVAPAPTHAELANRIGTHREAVTREMRSLVQMNVIRASRRSLQFVDIDRLQAIVLQATGNFD